MSDLPLAEADLRVDCVHADRCGGCPLISLPYPAQLALKRGRVLAALAAYPSLLLADTAPVLAAAPITGYRTRAKLIVGRGGAVGLFARGGGHQVVDIPSCRVLSAMLTRVAAVLRLRIVGDELAKGPLAPLDSKSGGLLRAVDLREIRGGDQHVDGVLVTLVVQRAASLDLAALTRAAESLLRASPEIIGVGVNLHSGDSPQVLGAETLHLAGQPAAFDRLGASTHLATYGSFAQAHRGQAERVHALIAGALGVREGRANSDLEVLDLYSGSGAIALSLAAAGANVHLVEAFAPAIAQAQRAAAEAGLTVTATCGDAAGVLRTLVDRGAAFDAVIVNPPRRGTSPAVRGLIARLGAPCVIYLSCDPATLARDLDHFARLGYLGASLRPLDMIPLTDEVESLAYLRRAPAPRPPVLYEDQDALFTIKGPHEPVSLHAEYTHSLEQRVRLIPGWEQAVAMTRLDPGTSGVVAFSRSAGGAAPWKAALCSPTSRFVHLAAARGVLPPKGSVSRALREAGGFLPARTRFRRIAIVGGHSIVRAVPEHDRVHQIRRHFSELGHPILGDDRYGHAPTNRFFEERNGLDRTFLHCSRIELTHPTTGRRLTVEAPLPGDLRMVLERANGSATLKWLDENRAPHARGTSSLPPPPDSHQEPGTVSEVDAAVASIRPQSVTDEDAGMS